MTLLALYTLVFVLHCTNGDQQSNTANNVADSILESNIVDRVPLFAYTTVGSKFYPDICQRRYGRTLMGQGAVNGQTTQMFGQGIRSMGASLLGNLQSYCPNPCVRMNTARCPGSCCDVCAKMSCEQCLAKDPNPLSSATIMKTGIESIAQGVDSLAMSNYGGNIGCVWCQSSKKCVHQGLLNQMSVKERLQCGVTLQPVASHRQSSLFKCIDPSSAEDMLRVGSEDNQPHSNLADEVREHQSMLSPEGANAAFSSVEYNYDELDE
eukprot:g2540.t1